MVVVKAAPHGLRQNTVYWDKPVTISWLVTAVVAQTGMPNLIIRCL